MTEPTSNQPQPPDESTSADRLLQSAEATRSEASPSDASIAGVAALAHHDVMVGVGKLPLWGRLAPQRRSTPWLRLMDGAAWCAAIGLLIVAGLRVASHDAFFLLTWFNAFTLYTYLPAYVLVVIACWRRRWVLLAASAVSIACHLAWVAPDFRTATSYQAPPNATEFSPPVRVFYANVLGRNTKFDAMFNEIASADPDVVVFVEANRGWFEAIKRSPVLRSHTHGTRRVHEFPGEIMIFSRLPLRRPTRIWVVGRVCVQVDIPLAGQSLRLLCLHSPRPIREQPSSYDTYWQEVMPIVAQEARPLVVLGDFNATQHSRVHKQFIQDGLRSAHCDRGRGYATTWPNGMLPIPPIRIDHAMLSGGVECLGIDEGIGLGSDHKPLVLDIRFTGGAGEAVEAANPNQQPNP